MSERLERASRGNCTDTLGPNARCGPTCVHAIARSLLEVIRAAELYMLQHTARREESLRRAIKAAKGG